MNKKSILLSIMLISYTFANDKYDLSRSLLESIELNTIGEMRINSPEGEIPFSVDIYSKNDKLKKLENGNLEKKYSSRMTMNISKDVKSTSTSEVIVLIDNNFKTISYSEKSVSDGIVKNTLCLPDAETQNLPIDKNFKKEIGFKSPVETLICDDGGSRQMSFSVKKGLNNTANIVSRTEAYILDKNMKIHLIERSVANINKDGSLNFIESIVVAKNMFSIYFKTDKIK